MTKSYAAENAIERQRLLDLTAKLTEENLNHLMPNGWTVAGTLVHLAYWELYYLALLQEWEKTGFQAVSANVKAVNAAVSRLSQAIPVLAVLLLAREAAEAIDRKVEEIAPELAAAIEAGGHRIILRRFWHRREHLDQIVSVLGY
jgi:hypothetical protein